MTEACWFCDDADRTDPPPGGWLLEDDTWRAGAAPRRTPSRAQWSSRLAATSRTRPGSTPPSEPPSPGHRATAERDPRGDRLRPRLPVVDDGPLDPHPSPRRPPTSDAVVGRDEPDERRAVTAALGPRIRLPAVTTPGSGRCSSDSPLAAVVAIWHTRSPSAQLAMTYPTSGGTYVYGREVLGEWWGFLAGWSFVVGKTASCAAMAATFAAYAVPAGRWVQRVVAAVAVARADRRHPRRDHPHRDRWPGSLLGLTLVVAGPGRRCARPAAARPPHRCRTWPLHGGAVRRPAVGRAAVLRVRRYARIATLAEEVRRPEQLGRAVLVALGIAIALYAAVALALLFAVARQRRPRRRDDPACRRRSRSPVRAGPRPSCGSGRPPPRSVRCSRCSPGQPDHAGDGPRARPARAPGRGRPGPPGAPPRAARGRPSRSSRWCWSPTCAVPIGFSSTGVLLYYAVANLSALRQPAERASLAAGRQRPRSGRAA